MEKNYKDENKSLWKITELISKSQKPELLVSGILKEATKLLDANASFIWLLQENSLNLSKGYHLGTDSISKLSSVIENEFKKLDNRFNYPFTSSNIEKDNGVLFSEILKKEDLTSFTCIPMKNKTLFAILAVFNKNRRIWTKKENRKLIKIAEQTVCTLERMNYLKKLEECTIRDGLTGLYSRIYFLNRSKEEMMRAHRKEEHVSFLFCDIDKFKNCNKIEGYTEGDRLLCNTAIAIKSSLRKEDTLCRYGGDEFIILLPNTDSSQAKRIAKRVHRSFVKAVEPKKHAILINLSIGIATYPDHGTSLEDILEKADRSMAFAKYSSTDDKIFIWNQWKTKNNELCLHEEDLLPEIVQALAKTVNLKDGYTSEHSKRVSKMASIFAKEIGLGEKSLRIIKKAALLYDIGKLIIPDHILNKPAPLNEEEWEIIKRNAKNSSRILKYIKGLENIIPTIREIRETWNGKGYPKGLSGDQISIEARLIALVDTYQALISTRPYRKKLEKEEAIKELVNEAGKKFDPKLVQKFVQIILK